MAQEVGGVREGEPSASRLLGENEAHGHYSMRFERDPRDEIQVVTISELPGCHTHGETLEEAVEQGRDALDKTMIQFAGVTRCS